GVNTVYVDSNYRPTTYNERLALFTQETRSNADLVFIGNSITAGADWGKLLNAPSAKNRGISGDITYGVLDRLDEALRGQPAKVFILIGTNDVGRNIPESYIINNYKRIIKRIDSESPNTKIYFHTILPVSNNNYASKNTRINTINAALKLVASKEGIRLIDSHSHFKDHEGKLDQHYTTDGLHLTAMGYEHWVALLRPYLEED